MLRAIPVALLTLLTASCQSDSPSKVERDRIYAHDGFEEANANCRMEAVAQQPGLYARGTPDYVAGARRQNWIETQRAYQRCMFAKGLRVTP